MERIQHRIERLLRTGEGDFNSLALDLFSYQYELNRPYQAYCKSLGIAPGGLSLWKEIPAVPIRAFKSSELATFPVTQAAAVFESSHTTGHMPSRHYLKTLSYYEASLKSGFQKALLWDEAALTFFVLAPTPGEAPRSSLTWMLDVVKRRWGAAGSDYFITRGRLDVMRLMRALDQAEKAGKPVALLGTTLAFISFFDHCKEHHLAYRLAEGSRVMDTGGMKTSSRNISREEFLASCGQYLGIAGSWCVSEYGMCELGSQFYAKGNDLLYQGPAWTRTLVIDETTGEETKGVGILQHIDLSNVDSVAAIQTDDLGQEAPGGFRLMGRAAGAELKGCSLAMEALLAR